MPRRSGVVLLVMAIVLVTACSRRAVPVPNMPDNAPTFVDLQSGWRLRLVVPVTRSGATEPMFRSQTTLGNTVTLSASDDLIGYETQYFALRGRGRLRVRFRSATITVNGRTLPEQSPKRQILSVPSGPEFLRLLFLQRASAVDHDMALIAASSSTGLRRKTEEVREDASKCAASQSDFCVWIPKGVAVIAERRVKTSGGAEWGPAQ